VEGGGSGFTEFVVVSENQFVGGNYAWTVFSGPQNSVSDERLRHIIWERNWFTAGSATQTAPQLATPETTVRNNLCDMTGGFIAGETCFAVAKRGIEPASR
jgi:hypothetical protein